MEDANHYWPSQRRIIGGLWGTMGDMGAGCGTVGARSAPLVGVVPAKLGRQKGGPGGAAPGKFLKFKN